MFLHYANQYLSVYCISGKELVFKVVCPPTLLSIRNVTGCSSSLFFSYFYFVTFVVGDLGFTAELHNTEKKIAILLLTDACKHHIWADSCSWFIAGKFFQPISLRSALMSDIFRWNHWISFIFALWQLTRREEYLSQYFS